MPPTIPLSSIETATGPGATGARDVSVRHRALAAGSKEPGEPDQKMVNRQARAVPDMLRTTPVGQLMREAGLESAEIIPQRRQLRYTAWLLGLARDQPAQCNHPVSLRDQCAQPGEQPEGDRKWTEPQGRGPWSLGQYLARQPGQILVIDPLEGFEQSVTTLDRGFPGETTILPGAEADGSRLEDGRTGAGIALQSRKQLLLCYSSWKKLQWAAVGEKRLKSSNEHDEMIGVNKLEEAEREGED